MGNHPESDKALRYISQLDEARCAGRWKDVPELCRKVEKHAPHRRCLTLTARSEAQIAAFSTQRPSTAASATSATTAGLSAIIPSLLSAVEEEGDHVQDAFQATVCLGWLHYVLDEPGLAIARFPKDCSAVAARLDGQSQAPGGWTRVCIVKGTYLKGSSLEKTGSTEDAIPSYSSILPWLDSKPINAETPQFRMWTEHLLVRLCHLSDQSSDTSDYTDPSGALQAFRFWAKYWESTAKGSGTEGAVAARYRRLAWKAYYDTLSVMLRNELSYEAGTNRADPAASEKPFGASNAKLQQRAELKRVEAIYESLLLKETQFPKASGTNTEITQWVDTVIENWRFVCGPTWTDADLGEGGKEAVGRGVLDILYRAATKTFHSTQILRHLFIVHASLAEFDLAFKAYDSYVEIITRGKDRAQKSGEEDVGIDDDSTILQTSAKAIKILCRFGSAKEAEKALQIGNQIEKWLEQSQTVSMSASETASSPSLETVVEPAALASAFCAIGISHAQWARFTYDATSRSSLQARAVQFLRKSLSPKLQDPNNLETLYALALTLAETRDVPGAIQTIKRALSQSSGQDSSDVDGIFTSGLTTKYGRERKLIPFWHLLALLLTARSDYAAAERACEAAFEQFGDISVLFGKEDENSYRSEHLNAINEKGHKSGIIDQMENFEKRGVLQVKLTQLSLLEVSDGSAAAVDGCDELLGLYARLFGEPTAVQSKPQPPSKPPPKSAVGTIRGSIFRSKGSVKNNQNSSRDRNSSVISSAPSTIATQGMAAPAIQVTDEDAVNGNQRHRLSHRKPHDEQSGPQRSPSKLQKRSANGLRRKSDAQNEQAYEVAQMPPPAAPGTATRSSVARSRSSRRASTSSSIRKSTESQEKSFRPIPHNMSHAIEPQPAGHAQQPPRQDTRLPAPFPNPYYVPPDPHFSQVQSRRQKTSLLVSIWVFIAGLYSRADMLDDAKDAVKEASTLVEGFESEVAQESSTSKAFACRGWGGGKSVEELWADVYAARGELLLAQSLQHEARVEFERAVLHLPDHPEAIVGLSNILLDIYSKAIPLEPSGSSSIATPSSSPSVPSVAETSPNSRIAHLTAHTPSAENRISPPELNRLAARDRAFGLLSMLTKHGNGWDYSEAWYALARAYEESGQVEKSKEVLWWCVELEDSHPIRNWKTVSLGGFVL